MAGKRVKPTHLPPVNANDELGRDLQSMTDPSGRPMRTHTMGSMGHAGGNYGRLGS